MLCQGVSGFSEVLGHYEKGLGEDIPMQVPETDPVGFRSVYVMSLFIH